MKIHAIYDATEETVPARTSARSSTSTTLCQFKDSGRAQLRQFAEWCWLNDVSDTSVPGGVDAERTAAGCQFAQEIRARRDDAKRLCRPEWQAQCDGCAIDAASEVRALVTRA